VKAAVNRGLIKLYEADGWLERLIADETEASSAELKNLFESKIPRWDR
jgi:hypothetical protein